MGVGFNWFKSYKVIEETHIVGWFEETEYRIKYLEGGSTSHSYGNRTKLQDIFYKYLGVEIPTIQSGSYMGCVNFKLIEPPVMSQMCEELLENKNNYELEDMEERIQWIKELSDEGYYVSYNMT